jgi:alkanesulfonate monooxygenase SsuD/methylene tetrahydromethanopterin reductase-like flavin-dependent oxidoreductase (luciferase family)
MRFALMIEAQQGLSYADQLALATRAEAAGFETFFRSDHYASFPGPAGRPTTDAWAVLAGLARETQRIGLGVLVSPVTFRHPGAFVKLVTTVDEMSGGRIEVGVGAGWNAADHHPLGLAFPPIEARADLLEDQLALLHGLWTGADGWSFDGHQVRLEGARFRPRPVDRPGRPRGPGGGARPRIIVGTPGSPRAMRLAARYADEINFSSIGPEALSGKVRRLEAICREVGRDPDTLTRSVMVAAVVGATEADLRDRRAALFREIGGAGDPEAWFEERRPRWILGTPTAARAMVARFEAAGAERIMLQDFLPRDLELVDLLARELLT